MTLTREQRVRCGLPPDPPPPYVPLEIDVVRKAIKRVERTAMKFALVSTAITALLAVPLWLLEPMSAIVFIVMGGPLVGSAVAKWWIARTKP